MKKGLTCRSNYNKIYGSFYDKKTGQTFFQSFRQPNKIAKHPIIRLACSTKSRLEVVKYLRKTFGMDLKESVEISSQIFFSNDSTRIEILETLDKRKKI